MNCYDVNLQLSDNLFLVKTQFLFAILDACLRNDVKYNVCTCIGPTGLFYTMYMYHILFWNIIYMALNASSFTGICINTIYFCLIGLEFKKSYCAYTFKFKLALLLHRNSGCVQIGGYSYGYG